MIAASEAPATTAAVTKSSSRSDRSLPRTTRARPVQPSTDRMMVTAKYTCNGGHSAGTAALSAIHSGMDGNERSSSMARWMIVSVTPPRYPEIPPRIRPRIRLRATPTRPIDSEIRAP